MKFSKITKSLYQGFLKKTSGISKEIPKNEEEAIRYLEEKCRSMMLNPQEDMSTYIKQNGLLLLMIWFSNNQYEIKLQIMALQNIIREYKQNKEIEEYFQAGITIESCQQMLISNAIESFDFPDDQIRNEIEYYKEILGDGEEIAYFMQSIEYEVKKGDFSNLNYAKNLLFTQEQGEHSDCYACNVNKLIRFFLIIEDYQVANEMIIYIFNKRLTCDQIPNLTFAQKLLTDSYLGKLEGNIKAQEKKALTKLSPDNMSFFEAYFLLKYAILKDRNEFAKSVIDRFKPALQVGNPQEKVFYCAACFAITKDVFYKNMAFELGEKFDKRNSNSFYKDMIMKIIK